MQHSGWRKPTPGLGIAAQHAQAGEGKTVPKSQAMVAVKRVAAHIGLKAGDVLLLDTLAAFTQPQDWSAGRRAIVWPSNAYLMDQTGFSLSALKRHARRLGEIGVISFQDSPNGKRWGKRDAEGVIIEAYGFDLSPLASRAAEFEELYAALETERAHCRRLRRQITVSRRMIRARIDAALDGMLKGPWAYLMQRFERLLMRLPGRHTVSETLEQTLDALTALQEQVETAFCRAEGAAIPVGRGAREVGQPDKSHAKLDPTATGSEPHIQITNELISVTCNRSETEQPATGTTEPQTKQKIEAMQVQHQSADRHAHDTNVDLSTVMQACPEFATWARNVGGYLRNWDDLHRAAHTLRPMIGISEHAWANAQDHLGPQTATAAFVLTFDKHCTGEVASPGGYLRGIIDKANAGELHLERSFFGRLSAQAA